MGVWKRITYSRLAVIAAAVTAVFMMSHFGPAPVLADDAAQMSISVSGCSGAECNLDNGETFTLSISVDAAPDDGYVLVQSFVDYGTALTYNMTDSPADEMLWPDGSPDIIARDSGDSPNDPAFPIPSGTVVHGGLTGVIPPLPLSTYTGVVFEIELQCSDSYSTNNVQLLPSGDAVAGTNGSIFTTTSVVDGVEESIQVVPKTNAVTVNCGEEPDEPPTPVPDVDIPTGGLPSSGSGGLSAGQGGSSAMLWLVIGALAVAGAAGLGAGSWRAARSRQE